MDCSRWVFPAGWVRPQVAVARERYRGQGRAATKTTATRLPRGLALVALARQRAVSANIFLRR